MYRKPPIIEPLKSWRSCEVMRSYWAEYIAAQANAEQALRLYVETGHVHDPVSSCAMPRVDSSARARPLPSRDTVLDLGLYIQGMRGFGFGCLATEIDEMLSLWRQAILAVELHSLLQFLREVEFPARFGRVRRGMSVEHAGWVAISSSIGAVETARRWAPMLVDASRKGYFLEYNLCGMHHFILRLWCAAHDQDYPQTGYPIYEVAEGVLAMWDTDDLEMLSAWLVQLCNQHTQLTRQKQFMDFQHVFSHVPVEILMLFRLREERGLPNPEVDHPLMKFPWSCLQPISPAEPDELLAAVYRRLEQDEGITRDGLYEQLMRA